MPDWPPGRILAIDLGDRRTGLATCDELGMTVAPRDVLEQRDPTTLLQTIAELVAEEEFDRIVLGLPLNMDGTEGDRAKVTRAFAKKLAATTPECPIEFWDERLTSVEAEGILKARGVHGSKRRGRVDAVAACVLLQAYLDHRRHRAHQDESTE